MSELKKPSESDILIQDPGICILTHFTESFYAPVWECLLGFNQHSQMRLHLDPHLTAGKNLYNKNQQ